jgi:hypothetical protein
VARIRLPHVPKERAQHRRRGRDDRVVAAQHAREIDRGHDAGRGALGVALDAGELAGEQRVRLVAEREVRGECGGRVDVRVAVDGAEAEKLRVLKARDHPKDALLLRVAEPRLEADHVPHLPRAVLHAELDHGVRAAAGPRILEADRLHRAEAERIAAALGHLLNRHAAFEVGHLVEVVRRRLVGSRQRVDERLVLLARHRAVEVGALIAGVGP